MKNFTARSAMAYLGIPDEERSHILSHYNAHHRKYHNESHLDNVLRWVDADSIPEDDLRVVLEAVLYHDVFYSARWVPTGFNEAMSLAMLCLGKRHGNVPLSFWDVLEVVQIINATAHHDKDQTALTDNAKLVLDLDLQSFAQPREEFLRDCHNVKLEYLPIVGEKLFLKGNKKFLQTLLKRKSLYYVKKEWEAPARENLEWRIKNMRAEPATTSTST